MCRERKRAQMEHLSQLSTKLQRENQELRGALESRDAEISRLQGALASVSRGANDGGVVGAHPESAVLTGAGRPPACKALAVLHMWPTQVFIHAQHRNCLHSRPGEQVSSLAAALHLPPMPAPTQHQHAGRCLTCVADWGGHSRLRCRICPAAGMCAPAVPPPLPDLQQHPASAFLPPFSEPAPLPPLSAIATWGPTPPPHFGGPFGQFGRQGEDLLDPNWDELTGPLPLPPLSMPGPLPDYRPEGHKE